MHGVRAPAGQTAPPLSKVNECSETPYWRYSTLIGGGRGSVCAEADGSRQISATTPNISRKPRHASVSGSAWLRALHI